VSLLPANLTPQYYAAEEKYKKARSPEEKTEALHEMLSVIPKHKGTEKLQADIKKRLALLREEGQKKKQKGLSNPFHVEKQGAGQVVLAGCPNSGKSSLVAVLTRAKVKVAAFPFTTTVPSTGMIPHEDVLVQLVDTPPFTADNVPAGLIGTFRNADALLLTVDLSADDCLEQLETTSQLLQDRGLIDPDGDNPYTLPYLFLGTKRDLPVAEAHLDILKEFRPEIAILPVSVRDDSMKALQERIYRLLDIIRIYGKAPGKPPDMTRPFILNNGATVVDLAYEVHRDFPDRLKTALVWGSSRFDGQAVPRDYILHDKDIVELVV
jgi:ribosome-interacting GTPase 1